LRKNIGVVIGDMVVFTAARGCVVCFKCVVGGLGMVCAVSTGYSFFIIYEIIPLGVYMKKIEGYDGYFITDDGVVWSNKSGGLKERKLQLNQAGYRMVTLFNERGRKGKLVSRLVLAAFKDRVAGKDYCNHLNGNKLDNRISNLEWCTIAENNRHSVEVLGNAPLSSGRSGRDHHCAKRYILSCPGRTREYETLREAVRLSGFSAYKIYDSIKYGNKLHVDYIWRSERIHGKNGA